MCPVVLHFTAQHDLGSVSDGSIATAAAYRPDYNVPD